MNIPHNTPIWQYCIYVHALLNIQLTYVKFVFVTARDHSRLWNTVINNAVLLVSKSISNTTEILKAIYIISRDWIVTCRFRIFCTEKNIYSICIISQNTVLRIRLLVNVHEFICYCSPSIDFILRVHLYIVNFF